MNLFRNVITGSVKNMCVCPKILFAKFGVSFFKCFFILRKKTANCIKKYKIDHISKTKNCTKIVNHAKNERQINSNLPCKFGNFWSKLNIWDANWARFSPNAPNWKFYVYHFFSTLRNFYVEMTTSKGGGVRDVRGWETPHRRVTKLFSLVSFHFVTFCLIVLLK